MPASGPLTDKLEQLVFFNDSQVGAIVTKTISVEGARVNKPCIVNKGHGIFNTELWSEKPASVWRHEILEKFHPLKKKPLFISLGYTKKDMETLIPLFNPYADFFEVSTHYNMDELKGLVSTIRQLTDKPFFIKLSPHIQDYIDFVGTAIHYGATGVVAINSVGPTMAIDLRQRKTMIGLKEGQSWMSGAPIKAIALHRVAMIRQAFPEVPIIGCGGVERPEDILEFILAGGQLVQMLSHALIKGTDRYDQIIKKLPTVMEDYDIPSMKSLINTQLSFSNEGLNHYPSIHQEACIKCQWCVKSCPEKALFLDGYIQCKVDLCVSCGLCESRCPVDAIKGVLSC